MELTFSIVARSLPLPKGAWEIQVTNDKSYTRVYLQQMYKLCKKKGFSFDDAENYSELLEDSASTTTLKICLRVVDGDSFNWTSLTFELILSTNPEKNHVYIVKNCPIRGNLFFLIIHGSDRESYLGIEGSSLREQLTNCVNRLSYFMKELNDTLIKSNSEIAIMPLPAVDSRIGKLLSESKHEEQFIFSCEESDYVLSISSAYLSDISKVFRMSYNVKNTIGQKPTNRRELNMSEYCLKVVFKKIIFDLSFSDVDFHRLREGDFFELLNFFCEFQMEFAYQTLISLFVKLNVTEVERSKILSCEFPQVIKHVVEIL